MLPLLQRRLRDRTISAVELYSKTLADLENKSHLNAFVHVNRDGVQQAEECQKRLQNGKCLAKKQLLPY